MRNRAARLGAIFLAAICLSGCAETFPYVTTLDSEKRYLEQDSAVLTEADKRAIVNVNQSNPVHGFVTPDRIVCAEPSPDVAKALSEGISLALQADVQGQGSGELQVGRSFAESIAQLGERLGTIQLLRDGFYRACEAYANGAISDTTYAMIVSGTDDVMATLLASEMAAGAFGRQQTTLGGAATGTTASVIADQQAVEASQEKLVKLRGKEAEDKEKLAIAESKDPRNQREIDGLRASIKKTEAEIAATQEVLNEQIDRSASSSARATLASGVGTISGGGSKQGADTVERIHRSFMRATNLNAFIQACVTTMDRRQTGNSASPDTQFAQVCRIFFGLEKPANPEAPFHLLLKEGPKHRERLAVIETFNADLLSRYLAVCMGGEVREEDKDDCVALKEILTAFAGAPRS